MRFNLWYPVAAVLVGMAVGLLAVAAQEPVVHEVKLLFDEQGFRFEPAGILIQPGDTVRFVSISGGPHTATLYSGQGLAAGTAVRIPEGAPAVSSDLLFDGATFDIVFDPALFPQGTYDYFCLPHMVLGKGHHYCEIGRAHV